MSIDVLKKRARNLQRAAKVMFNQPVKLSQAYELIAQEEGYANWDTASSALKINTGVSAPIAANARLEEYLLINKAQLDEAFVDLNQLAVDQPDFIPILSLVATPSPKLILLSGKTEACKTAMASALLIYGQQQSKSIALKTSGDIPSKFKEIMNFPHGDDVRKAFRQAVMHALRSDPDRVYMGEIRNPEALKIALEMVRSGRTVVAEVQGGRGQSMNHLLIERMLGDVNAQSLVEDLDSIDKIHLHLIDQAE